MHSFAAQVSNFFRATSARIASFLSRLDTIKTRMNRRTIFRSRSSATGHRILLQRPIRHPRQRLLIRLLRFRRPGPGQRPKAHLPRPPADLFIRLPAGSGSSVFLRPSHFVLCLALMVLAHAALAHRQPEQLQAGIRHRLICHPPCRTAIYPPSPAAPAATHATSSRSGASCPWSVATTSYPSPFDPNPDPVLGHNLDRIPNPNLLGPPFFGPRKKFSTMRYAGNQPLAHETPGSRRVQQRSVVRSRRPPW